MSNEKGEVASAPLKRMMDGIKEVSHEINNPLGVIRMAVHFLQHVEASPDKHEQYCNAINESIDKIEVLLKKLKDLRESSHA